MSTIKKGTTVRAKDIDLNFKPSGVVKTVYVLANYMKRK